MIELPRSTSQPTPPRLKVLGIGSAGCNILDRLVLDGLNGAELIALNTDVQALAGCVAPRQVHIGQNVTRGLGTGGDPELGYAAAEQAMAEITGLFEAGDVVYLLGGLGGGTASGALPLIAHAAREQGAQVVAIATLPFAFEGKRRHAQAAECLATLRRTSDLLICFENDRMGEIVSARAGIQEAFKAVDATLSQCLRSLAALTQHRGVLHAGFAELTTLFHRADRRALFGSGEAEGDNRAHEAAAALLKSPLLDHGQHLKEIEAAFIHVAGGPDLTLHEVQTLMEELRRHLPEDADTFFGLAVDPALAGRLSVTVLGALPSIEPAAAAAPHRPAAKPLPLPDPVASEEQPPIAPEPEIEEPAPAIRPRMRPLFAPTRNARHTPAPEVEPDTDSEEESETEEASRQREFRQEQMELEPVNRGRFEKSEPTIIDGEDLDVPTFLRRNLRLRR